VNRLAVVTIVHGRRAHLELQHRGLERSSDADFDWIVVAMDEPGLSSWEPPGTLVPQVLHVPREDRAGLPLARARNLGARSAMGRGAGILVFLDVDCIPSPSLVARYRSAAERTATAGTLICGTVSYLPPTTSGYDLDRLDDLAEPHPARPAPGPEEVLLDGDHDLFWSLSFAVRAETWRAVGGFCDRFAGYGGEDTDFAAKARALGVGVSWVGGAGAFHQHHPTSDPPRQHLVAILDNARLFHARWGRWPMLGWLDAFVRDGLLLRTPSGFELP
jgi:N-acetylglucosaminyl-diphospho-decaprenol L-rhamnosyltransferase